jgi:hypothetical protein
MSISHKRIATLCELDREVLCKRTEVLDDEKVLFAVKTSLDVKKSDVQLG